MRHLRRGDADRLGIVPVYSLVFLHQVRLPLKADYARPEIYGYAREVGIHFVDSTREIVADQTPGK